MKRERLFFRPAEFYEKENINLYLDQTALSIDPKNKTVLLENGTKLEFKYLVLATGSRPRKVPNLTTELNRVWGVRSIACIEAMQPHFKAGKKLIIIGGGYIGLETAAVANKMGLETIVVEAADRVLARVTDPIISRFYERIHAEEGVKIMTSTGVAGLEGGSKVTGVKLIDGSVLPADIVVLGIGIVPNVEIAEAAGLNVDNGIVVDEYARTSHRDIYAAGDCTQHPNGLLGRTLRLESVQNAIEQGKAVASHILGEPAPYHEIPWFWSDQYDTKLQIVGLSGGHDKTVIRGDETSRSFAAFYFHGVQLIAVDAINRPAEFMLAKKLIHAAAEGAIIDPTKLADESIHPKELLKMIEV